MYFSIKHNSKLKEINAEVPEGNVLGPYFTNDIPKLEHHTIATSAEDIAIPAVLVECCLMKCTECK